MAKKNFINPEKSSKVSSPSTAALTTVDNESTEKVPECELSEEERKELFEKYQLSGEFEKDFSELSSYLGVQLAVTHRAKVLTISPPEPCVNKSKDDKKNQNVGLSALEPTKNCEVEEVLPVTYTTCSDKYEYLKPHVEIDTEGEVGKGSIKSLFFRGWKVDWYIISVLSATLPDIEQLTSITMWNVGLTDETVTLLWECLSSSSSLKKLNLDGNSHVTTQKFDIFLSQSDKLCLQSFSLRNCNLDAIGALYLGKVLSDNKNLQSLNLCFNQLGSEGAKHLADGLRFNRTLLSLNIGSNGIGDEGAKCIAQVLSTYPLTHDQVVSRRMLQSSYFSGENSEQSSQERPQSTARSHSEKKSREKSIAKKKETSNSNKSKEVTIKRDKSNLDTSKGQKSQKPKSREGKVERNKSPFQDTEDSYDAKDPLLEKVSELNGELWIPGNRALINLNLARNNISEVGLEALYSAMKFQVDLAHETNRLVATGLMRLSLQRNKIPLDNPTYSMLNDLMKKRDPFYKPQAIDSIEEYS